MGLGSSAMRTAVLTALAALATLVVASAAIGAKVTPTFLPGASNSGKTCADNAGAGQAWTELKIDPNANGTYSDGTLTVTIANTQNDKTFDWTSNIGVDAVVVKGGSDGSYLYRYDPPSEETSDSGLTTPGSNAISHISFCYDVTKPKLELRKDFVGAPAGAQVTLSIAGVAQATVGDGGSTGKHQVDPGIYQLGETGAGGLDLGDYTSSLACVDAAHGNAPVALIDGNKVSVGFDQDVVCTFTNTKKPKLTVVKIVVNDNGGTKLVADFPLFVNAQQVQSGVATTLAAGSYVVSETGHSDYTATIGGDCDANGGVTLAGGEHKTCTITNDDKPAKLIVIKNVVGGSKSPGDFQLTIHDLVAQGGNTFAGQSGAGTTRTLLTVGSYSVVEGAHDGYTVAYSADCAGTIALGQTKTCTVTNTAIQTPPPPPPPPPVPAPTLIDLTVTKADTPDPLNVNGQLTYTLVVTNKGPSTATNVLLVDPLPGPMAFLSVSTTQGTCTGGATISCNLGTLAANASATVTVVVRATQAGQFTNIVTVSGQGGEQNTADNTASAVTTVLAPLTPPTAKPTPKPAVCVTLTVSTRAITVGKRATVTTTVRAAGKPVKGARVLVRGAGIRVTATTNAGGRAVVRITARKAGILLVSVTNKRACGAKRIGVVGAFEPPVTG